MAVTVIYGRRGCARCHRALELLADAQVLCETVDIDRCKHCHKELCERLGLLSIVDAPIVDLGFHAQSAKEGPGAPQAWSAIDGSYIGTLEDLASWLQLTKLGGGRNLGSFRRHEDP